MPSSDRCEAVAESVSTSRPTRGGTPSDLRARLNLQVAEELGPALYDGSLSDGEIRLRAVEIMEAVVDNEPFSLSPSELRTLLDQAVADLLGFGPISALLEDPEVMEVTVDGPHDIYYMREGKTLKSGVKFLDKVHLSRFIRTLADRAGRRVDESTPIATVRLSDGIRVHAVVAPVAIGGPYLTIMKHAVDPFQEADLVHFGTLTQEVADILRACVRGRLNIVISGEANSGRTTLLGMVASTIPINERIVTVESVAELQVKHERVVTLVSPPLGSAASSQITVSDVVRAATHMSRVRIVVGEVQGSEASQLVYAMSTGKDGAIFAIESDSPADTISRLEKMMANDSPMRPIGAIRQQIASALDLIVRIAHLHDGSRRITHVTSVEGMEGENVLLRDLFRFDSRMGVDESGRDQGRLKATGLRPAFVEDLEAQGIRLPSDLFDPEPFSRSVVNSEAGC